MPALDRSGSQVAEPPTLWVHDEVLARLAGLPARPWEVGGWLLGFWTGAERDVFVTHATPPVGRGTPFGVRVAGRGHRDRFDDAWDASGGHITFVGDWHTHPGCPATPSQRDATALRQLADGPDYGTSQPIAAITQTPRWPFSAFPRETRWYVFDGENVIDEVEPRIVSTLPEQAHAVPHWQWPRPAP